MPHTSSRVYLQFLGVKGKGMGVEYLIGKIRQHFCLIFVDILVELTNTVVEAKIQVTHSV